MTVKDLMTINVRTIRPDDGCDLAAEIMRAENVGCIPVCDSQNHLLGLITDRDIIVRRGFGRKASEIMTACLHTVTSRQNIHDAALEFSRHGVRRLPVVDDGRLVGMLTLKDLAGRRIFMAEIGHIVFDISNYENNTSAYGK